MSARWIEHKGKKILYVDYRGKNLEGLREVLAEESELVRKASGRVRILANVEGTLLPPEFMEEIKRVSKEVLKPRTEKSAVVGVEGLKAMLLKAFNLFVGGNMRSFANEEQARDWLAE